MRPLMTASFLAVVSVTLVGNRERRHGEPRNQNDRGGNARKLSLQAHVISLSQEARIAKQFSLIERATDPAISRHAIAALASVASGQRGHSIGARAGHSPQPGSSARAALASVASGQRGHSIGARA